MMLGWHSNSFPILSRHLRQHSVGKHKHPIIHLSQAINYFWGFEFLKGLLSLNKFVETFTRHKNRRKVQMDQAVVIPRQILCVTQWPTGQLLFCWCQLYIFGKLTRLDWRVMSLFTAAFQQPAFRVCSLQFSINDVFSSMILSSPL